MRCGGAVDGGEVIRGGDEYCKGDCADDGRNAFVFRGVHGCLLSSLPWRAGCPLLISRATAYDRCDSCILRHVGRHAGDFKI